MATTNPPNPPNVYLTFCSAIDQASVGRLLLALDVATQRNAQEVHLLFQSTGGTVGDGVCLYNFLRTLPVKLTLYNVGSVNPLQQ
jgi:ATP-dependent Clp protease, protease subunit